MKLKVLMYASAMMLLSQTKSQAQTESFNYDSLDINNLSVIIESNGDMHRDTSYSIHSSMPAGSNSSAISAQCLWMGGYDENVELRLAANTYRQAGNDYWPGPVGNYYDTSYDEMYDKVWHLKKSEIENHINQYNSVGYIIPDDIEHWPANGNLANGEATNLAPYQDINSNNIYEPELGEYPLIRGDEALYVIYNDDRNVHSESGGQKIKAEIHHMLYAYYSSGEEYNDYTVYSHYEIYNRSTLNFPNFYVSNFLDIDLGYSIDDRFGTEVSKNLIYGYNSSNNDSVNFGGYYLDGYGYNPPALGYVLLNQDMVYSMSYHNDFNAVFGNPAGFNDFYNYMRAKWRNGNPIIHPVDSIVSNYTYTDLPDTTDNTNWSEMNFPNNYAHPDKRMLSTIYKLNFGPGDKICMDNAIIFAHDTTLTHLDQISHLFNLTDQVQNFYDNQYDNCEDISDLSINEEITIDNQNIHIYQDQNMVSMELKESYNQDIQIKILDVLGREVTQTTLQQGELTLQIDLKSAIAGTYFIQCYTNSFNESIQFIKY